MQSKSTYAKLFKLALFLFAFTFTGSAYSQILLQTSFEGPNPWSGVSNSQSCCSHSVTASTERASHGSQSFRAEVRANDPAVSSGYRAEITTPGVSDVGDMWYGWSMYFEKNGTGNWSPGCCGHMVQWHPENSSGSASLSLWYTTQGGSAVWDVAVNPSGGSGVTHQTQRADGGPLLPIVANTWHDVVFHCNWNTGLIEFYLNGVLYFQRSGLNYAGGPGQYFKLGMNRWTMNNTWVIFYDNLKIGRNVTYNDVAPNSAPPANQPPVANAGSNQTITLPTSTVTLNGSVSDPDDNISTVAWTRVSGPTTYNITNPSSAITTVTGLVQGTYVFRLTVTDEEGATDTDNVSITVNPPANVSPTANAGNDITLTLPVNSTTLSGSGNDTDGSIASYAWARVSGPTTYTLGSPNSATTALTNLVQGTYVFRLTVTDNNGATGTDNVTVTVNGAANQPPLANAGGDVSITLPVNSTTLNGTAMDADGSIASYAWSRVSGPTTFTIGSPTSASTVVSNLVQGTYVFRLTVTDDDGATDTDDVSVVVNASTAPANNPPVANAGANITITLPVSSTTLSGSATDSDGTISSYSWARVSGPASHTFANANAASTLVSNLVQGTYVFRLTVTDDDGATDTDDVTVVVNAAPNQAPVANAGNDVLMHLPISSGTLIGTGSTDNDGNIVSYVWSKVSGPTSFTIVSPNASTTSITNLVMGVYVFRLTVTDDDGATAIDQVTVTVNAPPVANAGTNTVLTLPTNATTLNGSGSSDPDGTITTYTWTRISGPTTLTFANANAVSTGVSNLVQGVYVFRLTVRDNRGAVTTADVTVTVNAAAPPPPNQAPVARTTGDIVLHMPNNTARLDGTQSTDADGSIVYREWTQLAGPTTATLTNSLAATTDATDLVVGVYQFELRVRDNDGAESTTTINVTVKNKNNEDIYCNLYPNPATTTLNVKYIDPENGQLIFAIYDANNRLLAQEMVSKDMVTLVHTLDVSRLNGGVYFLKITSKDKKVVRKFVKN